MHELIVIEWVAGPSSSSSSDDRILSFSQRSCRDTGVEWGYLNKDNGFGQVEGSSQVQVITFRLPRLD